MMFALDLLCRGTPKDNPDAINIRYRFPNPCTPCMACGGGLATVVRRVDEPFELNAHLCGTCKLLPGGMIHAMVMARFKRRVK